MIQKLISGIALGRQTFWIQIRSNHSFVKPDSVANCLHRLSVDVSWKVLIDFSLTEKAATLIFISGRGSAISSVRKGIRF